MANTYSQLYTQIIFIVKDRAPLIPKDRREELHKYITGIITNNDCKLIAINSMPDHLHIFLSMHPKIAISDLVRDIKSNSSAFIKNKGWSKSFAWQEGFGAFSYSRSQRDDVIRYVQNQEEHHEKKTFREEYIDFLKAFHIEYDERYIFEARGYEHCAPTELWEISSVRSGMFVASAVSKGFVWEIRN